MKSAILALLGAVAADPVSASLEVSRLFGDGAVLQRGVAVPVWGAAEPGAPIRVRFAGQSHRARADEAGEWAVELTPVPAGGPFEMTIEAAGESLRLRDLLVGDVWVCSGQSNMEWVVASSLDAEAEMAAADDRAIRHFKVPRSWSARPERALLGGGWRVAAPQTVGAFTAVGYFFARELRREVGVPIGLINSTWGGSRIEAWMSAEALGLDEAGVELAFELERDYERQVRQGLRERAGRLPQADEGLVDGRALWADPDLDDSSWLDIRVPSLWEEDGWEGLDGIAWYRTVFELSAGEAARGVRLALGAVDDSDTTWVNGREVGRTEMAWNQPRVYEVPPSVLVEGRNVIAVRVEDTGGGGGIYGDPRSLFVAVGGVERPLDSAWKFRLGVVSVNLEDHKREVPTVLFNQMVRPLQRFPVRGVLWYQGESNAWGEDAYVYRRHFRRLIEDWRAGWGVDLPFLFVQLANFMAPVEVPGGSDWALLRESQSLALELPGTAQAVAIDAGEADDVHPRDKQVIGRRLALTARVLVHGEELVHSGPVYRRHEVVGGRVVVEFDHTAGGLVAENRDDGRLAEFALAGADRRFVRAEARVEGKRVVVWSDRVRQPVAVRYAWADNPDRANLYNRAGLPASPFRTDDWQGGTLPEEKKEP